MVAATGCTGGLVSAAFPPILGQSSGDVQALDRQRSRAGWLPTKPAVFWSLCSVEDIRHRTPPAHGHQAQ